MGRSGLPTSNGTKSPSYRGQAGEMPRRQFEPKNCSKYCETARCRALVSVLVSQGREDTISIRKQEETVRGIDTGHYVQPGNGSTTSPLLSVARMDKVRIFVDIPEMEAGMVSEGEQGDQAVAADPELYERGTAVSRRQRAACAILSAVIRHHLSVAPTTSRGQSARSGSGQPSVGFPYQSGLPRATVAASSTSLSCLLPVARIHRRQSLTPLRPQTILGLTPQPRATKE